MSSSQSSFAPPAVTVEKDIVTVTEPSPGKAMTINTQKKPEMRPRGGGCCVRYSRGDPIPTTYPCSLGRFVRCFPLLRMLQEMLLMLVEKVVTIFQSVFLIWSLSQCHSLIQKLDTNLRIMTIVTLSCIMKFFIQTIAPTYISNPNYPVFLLCSLKASEKSNHAVVHNLP